MPVCNAPEPPPKAQCWGARSAAAPRSRCFPRGSRGFSLLLGPAQLDDMLTESLPAYSSNAHRQPLRPPAPPSPPWRLCSADSTGASLAKANRPARSSSLRTSFTTRRPRTSLLARWKTQRRWRRHGRVIAATWMASTPPPMSVTGTHRMPAYHITCTHRTHAQQLPVTPDRCGVLPWRAAGRPLRRAALACCRPTHPPPPFFFLFLGGLWCLRYTSLLPSSTLFPVCVQSYNVRR